MHGKLYILTILNYLRSLRAARLHADGVALSHVKARCGRDYTFAFSALIKDNYNNNEIIFIIIT